MLDSDSDCDETIMWKYSDKLIIVMGMRFGYNFLGLSLPDDEQQYLKKSCVQ